MSGGVQHQGAATCETYLDRSLPVAIALYLIAATRPDALDWLDAVMGDVQDDARPVVAHSTDPRRSTSAA